MMHQLDFPLTVIAALGSGLMAGTFFAFSVFVMGALGRLPTEQGISAMQSINVVVLNALFLGVFLGTAVVCTLLGGMTVFAWPSSGAGWRLAGCLLYVAGSFLITMAFNVPLNNHLARVTAGTPEAASVWAFYQARWTAWNHVRTVAPLAALACFIMAMRAGQ
jgi:uncharacterized membrane protein